MKADVAHYYIPGRNPPCGVYVRDVPQLADTYLLRAYANWDRVTCKSCLNGRVAVEAQQTTSRAAAPRD
jgi:hypothetical protein